MVKINKNIKKTIINNFSLFDKKLYGDLEPNRNEIIFNFNINKNANIKNGKFKKKIWILDFFLKLKFGELFFTRSKFVFLKKNKKFIKR